MSSKLRKYNLCRFGTKTDCPFESQANIIERIEDYMRRHYKTKNRIRQSISGQKSGRNGNQSQSKRNKSNESRRQNSAKSKKKMSTNMRPNRSRNKRFNDLTQYEAKVEDKSVYYLCRFGGKTDCPFKSKANSIVSIKTHISAHYRGLKTNRQSISGQRRHRNKKQNKRYKCDESGCGKTFKRIHLFRQHMKYHLFGSTNSDKKSEFNRSENKSKTRDELKSNSGSDEDLSTVENVSDPRTNTYKNLFTKELRIRVENNIKILPKIKSKKTIGKKAENELTLNLNFVTSSADKLPSVQSVSDPQTEDNRINSIINNENNNKRKVLPKIADKIKSKKTIAKTFKCSEKYCKQRFKHKMLFIKHKNWHKNRGKEKSLTNIWPNIKDILKGPVFDQLIESKVKECLSQQKSQSVEEMNGVNGIECKIEETNEDSIVLIDLTVDESEDKKSNHMSEQKRNDINTTVFEAKTMDCISEGSNTRHTNPSTSNEDWRAQLLRIEPFNRFMFTEMTKYIDSVVKESGNVSQNQYFWSLVAKQMTANGYKGFDVFNTYRMFSLIVKHYALVLANSPDERTAKEVFPLFACIHALDLSQSLSQSSSDIISDLRQKFAQKYT